MSNENIIKVLENILQEIKIWNNKGETDILLHTKENNITVYFENPISIDNGAQIALKKISAYYSIPNIDARNNNFRYKNDSDDFIDISLKTESYAIESIANEIEDKMRLDVNNIVITKKDKDNFLGNVVRIKPSTSIAKFVIKIPASYVVDFTTSNLIRKTLGFTPYKLTAGRYFSDTTIDINPVNSILLHCDQVSRCAINGQTSRCIYSFTPNVPPCYKIIEEARQLVYYSVDQEYIRKIKVWLTDEELNPINFRCEEITITLSLKN